MKPLPLRSRWIEGVRGRPAGQVIQQLGSDDAFCCAHKPVTTAPEAAAIGLSSGPAEAQVNEFGQRPGDRWAAQSDGCQMQICGGGGEADHCPRAERRVPAPYLRACGMGRDLRTGRRNRREPLKVADFGRPERVVPGYSASGSHDSPGMQTPAIVLADDQRPAASVTAHE